MRYLVTMTIDIEEIREKASAKKTTRVPDEVPKPEPAAPPPVTSIKPMVYGVKDAAKILGISRSSIYILLKEGQLSPIRIGRRLLFHEGELQALVERNRRP